ncbi:MAG: hypothetical protein AAB341_04445 [Planctomycetota bacterium]
MTYDGERGVTVLFGGSLFESPNVLYGDTWEWNGTTWSQRSLTGPSAGRHAMAYDSARGVTVLFGDTWEWDGTAWTQRSTTGPSPRYEYAMAYDGARGVTVLFGGNDDVLKGDTWEWDGTTWTQRSTTGPSPRYQHAMAYDSARGVTVLFGGGDGSSSKGDTWEWNGTTWTLRSLTGPSPRVVPAMAYDSARGVTVLFGGAWGGYKGDTWEWNGTTWMQRSLTGPSPRYGHAMAYDSARGVTVLFGGWNNSPQGDTWEWNGTTWALRSLTGPSPRYEPAVAYDSARGVTVLFGGYDGTSSFKGDTWEWNGTTWTLRSLTGPSPRVAHAMAYDSARGVTVLFGGWDGSDRGDTWEFANCAVVSGLSIAPGGATDFGSVAVGATADRGFTLRNTGSNPIVGSASAPSPFSVVGGSNYNLAPGGTQAVTVRYSPTQSGNNIAYITFTGTGTQQRQLLGSAFATPTFGAITGTVVEQDATSATGEIPVGGLLIVSGTGQRSITSPDGNFSLPGLNLGPNTLSISDPNHRFLSQTTISGAPIIVVPDVPVQLHLVVVRNQIIIAPPPGTRTTPVLLVSGFGCTDPPWDTGSCNTDYCDFACDKSTWEKVWYALLQSGFDFPDKDYVGELIWDPNEPTPGFAPPHALGGQVLKGTERILPNATRLKNYVTEKMKQYKAERGEFPDHIDIVASSMGGLMSMSRK